MCFCFEHAICQVNLSHWFAPLVMTGDCYQTYATCCWWNYSLVLILSCTNWTFLGSLTDRQTPIQWRLLHDNLSKPPVVKPVWILMKQEIVGWQWHPLDHRQIICTLLQIDNHESTSSLIFYRPAALPDAQPTVSKHWRQVYQLMTIVMCNNCNK